MNELIEANKSAQEIFNNNTSWAEWHHEGTKPTTTHTEKRLLDTNKLTLIKHCMTCINLNSCWFQKNKMPPLPLHPNCHCTTTDKSIPIANITAFAQCDITKFTDYIFNPNNPDNEGKIDLFMAWGYTKEDSKLLKEELERQATQKYVNGDYELGKLDEYGQRINIEIILPRKDKFGTINFKSGFMVYPNGIIQNTTPYGAK